MHLSDQPLECQAEFKVCLWAVQIKLLECAVCCSLDIFKVCRQEIQVCINIETYLLTNGITIQKQL